MSNPAINSQTPIFVYSGSAFVEIPGATSNGLSGTEVGSIEVSNMSSNGFKEYIPAPLAEPGTFDFSLQFNPSNAVHMYLMKHASSGSVDIWKMQFSNGVEYAFTGSLTKLSVKSDNPGGAVLTSEASVKLSGAVSGNFAV